MRATIPAPASPRSRARRTVAVALTALTLTLAATAGSTVQAQSSPETALLDALARVPATADALATPVSYVDYKAVASARPGALEPTSLSELLELAEADDPAAARWLAASMGIASGPADLLSGLFSGGPSWPTSVGFDFTDIDRAVTFGTPPANGTVLMGAFDPAAIEAAYAARDYTATPADDRTLLCSANGCDAGLDVDLASMDPSVPFGGRLGRQEPLAASSSEILSSADIGTVDAMLATASGDSPALADDPAFRAVATAPADDLTVIQATLLPVAAIVAGPDVAAMLGERATPEQIEEIIAEFEALETMPAPTAVAIIDGATPTEQVVTLALAYPTEADATRAADVVAERLMTVDSLMRAAPLADLLEERGLTSIESEVRPAGPDTEAAAVIRLRAPLAGDEPTELGGLPASSMLYRLFVDLVYARDLLWLAPAGCPA
jgi:hypothetical protein